MAAVLETEPLPAPTPILTPKLADLFLEPGTDNYAPSRYKVAYGGRGSGKSWGFTGMAVALGTVRRLRVLCVREVQNSIRESIHRLLSDRIAGLGLSRHYDVQREGIYGPSGTEFIFAGMRNDPGKIRSAEGIDVCLVEEGQKISDESWRTLIPTIRTLGSEFWVCFNPMLEKDSTYQRFVVETPPDCRRVEVNWDDNPWFPQVLDLERRHALQRIADARDTTGKANLQRLYDHVWGGQPLRYLGAFFSEGSLLVNGLALPDMPLPVDVVFATIDTALKTGLQHDGVGVIYWGYSRRRSTQYGKPALFILDWDLKQIEGGMLAEWLPGVFATLQGLAKECKAIKGSIGAYIEDKVSGTVLIQQARHRKLGPVWPIDSKFTSIGKSARAASIDMHVHAEDVKMCQRAYDRTVSYHGDEKNHLLSQVLDFNPMAEEDAKEDDLLDCFCYGIAVTLGNTKGFG
jgi:hypothetical protein